MGSMPGGLSGAATDTLLKLLNMGQSPSQDNSGQALPSGSISEGPNLQGMQTNPMDIVNAMTGGQPLTTSQPSLPQASMPPQMKVPPIQFGKPDGGFSSSGERKRIQSQEMMGNIGNIVRSATDYVQERKMRSMAMHTERLLSAMEGVNEGKASGNQEQIEHNQNIINSMLDPTTPEGKKLVKDFEKVFSVNLLGEHKDKDSPEYKGFNQAFAKWKTGAAQGQKGGVNPIAQKLMSMQPQRTGLNPQLQAMMQAVKGGLVPDANAMLKGQTETQKNMIELQRVFTEAQTKGFDRNSKEKIAQMLVGSRDRNTAGMILRGLMSQAGAKERAEIMSGAMKYKADMAYKAVIDNPRWKYLADKAIDEKGDKRLKAMSDMVQKNITEAQNEYKQFMKDHKDFDPNGAWNKQFNKEEIQQLNGITARLDRYKQLQDLIISQYSNKYGDNLNQILIDSLANESNDMQRLDDEDMKALEMMWGPEDK